MQYFNKAVSKSLSIIVIAVLLVTIQSPLNVEASISPAVTESGYISWSIDGIGTTGTGTIQVNKPTSATVRSAYVAASSSPFKTTADGAITINGSGITWDTSKTVLSGVQNMTNTWADVTSIVKPIVDAADSGTIDLTIVDSGNTNEGLALIVIFDDPSQTVKNTVILMTGSQNPAGDTSSVMLANEIDKSASGFAINLSLGIAFGYQPTPPSSSSLGQYSIVEVKDSLLTSAAGGQDDAFENPTNGNLVTVGGLGDSIENPANPSSITGNYRSDDELYDLAPYVNNGDTTITIKTQNPSNDDNIFFIGYYFGANTALVGDGDKPGLLSASPNIGAIAGGTSVTLTGINLNGVTGITFGGTSVDVSSCTSITSTSIICPSPAHAAGLVDITVTTPDGTATLGDSFTYEEPPDLTVTIDQASTQADPASKSPIRFTATFSESVTGFTASDISFTGSTTPDQLTASVSGSDSTYKISVYGMTGSGTVILSIPSAAAQNSVGTANLASSSIDNSVTYNITNLETDNEQDTPNILPVTGFLVGKTTVLAIQPEIKGYAQSEMILAVPSLNISVPIVEVPLVDNAWDVTWLGSMIGYLEGTAFPTWSGNTVLTGHVWNADNTPGVFVNIKNLRYGDQISIYAYGSKYTYEVRENELLKINNVFSVFKHETLDWVTLLTCEGYDPISENYSYRRVVRAVLISVK